MTSSIQSFTLGDFAQLSYHNPIDLTVTSNMTPIHTCFDTLSSGDQIFLFATSDSLVCPITIYIKEKDGTTLNIWKKRVVRKEGNSPEILFNGSLLCAGSSMYIMKDEVNASIITVFGYIRRNEIDQTSVTTTTTTPFSTMCIVSSAAAKTLIHTNNSDKKHLIHLNADSANSLTNYMSSLRVLSSIYKQTGRFMYNHDIDIGLSVGYFKLWEEELSSSKGLNDSSTQIKLDDVLSITTPLGVPEYIKVDHISINFFGSGGAVNEGSYNTLSAINFALPENVPTVDTNDPQIGVKKVFSTHMPSNFEIETNSLTIEEVVVESGVSYSGSNYWTDTADGNKVYQIRESYRDGGYVVFKKNNAYAHSGSTHEVIPAIYEIQTSYFVPSTDRLIVQLISSTVTLSDGSTKSYPFPVTDVNIGFLNMTSTKYNNSGVDGNAVFIHDLESQNLDSGAYSYIMLPWDVARKRVVHPLTTLNIEEPYPALANTIHSVPNDILQLTDPYLTIGSRPYQKLLKVTDIYKIEGVGGFDILDSIGLGTDTERRILLANSIFSGSIKIEQYGIDNIALTTSEKVGLVQGMLLNIAFEKSYQLKRGYDVTHNSYGSVSEILPASTNGTFEILSNAEHTFLKTPVNKAGGRTTRVLQNVCLDPKSSIYIDGVESTGTNTTNYSGYIIEVNNS